MEGRKEGMEEEMREPHEPDGRFLNKCWIYFMFASGRGSIRMFGKEKPIKEKNLEADLDKLSEPGSNDSRSSTGGPNGMTSSRCSAFIVLMHKYCSIRIKVLRRNSSIHTNLFSSNNHP